MTEKLKYKVGDKVWVQGEIIEADYEDSDSTYKLSIGEDDYNSKRWFPTEWFEDGRVKSVLHPPLEVQKKPKVPQAVMDWYEEYENKRADWRISDWLSDINTLEGMDDWLYGENHLHNQHALATLIAYGPEAVEVEKEKKYRVKLKATGQILRKHKDKYFFTADSFDVFPKQELIAAGFEGVFDNSMFEVEEVE